LELHVIPNVCSVNTEHFAFQQQAGKSVMASNSMIERVFHTLKNEFGSVHVARDGVQLEQILTSTIDAYMNRPHSAHGIYTPLEVLEGRDNWLDVKKVIADAKKERIEANKVARCENCSCSVEERCSEGVGENGNGQK